MKYMKGIGAVLVVVFGAWFIDDRFASAGQLKQVVESVAALTERINRDILNDRMDEWKQRKVDMEIRYGFDCSGCDQNQRAIYSQILRELERIARELQ